LFHCNYLHIIKNICLGAAFKKFYLINQFNWWFHFIHTAISSRVSDKLEKCDCTSKLYISTIESRMKKLNYREWMHLKNRNMLTNSTSSSSHSTIIVISIISYYNFVFIFITFSFILFLRHITRSSSFIYVLLFFLFL
jgi:hypothetical protein